MGPVVGTANAEAGVSGTGGVDRKGCQSFGGTDAKLVMQAGSETGVSNMGGDGRKGCQSFGGSDENVVRWAGSAAGATGTEEAVK